jgi:hypothetical protein
VIPNTNKEKNQEHYDYKETQYYDLDLQFITSICARMKEMQDIDDQDLSQAFQSYT